MIAQIGQGKVASGLAAHPDSVCMGADGNVPMANQVDAARKLDAALAYAALGIPVVPLHGVVDNKCTCYAGEACKTPGKHPIPLNGYKGATVNTAGIQTAWKYRSYANIGLAMGARVGDEQIVGVDIDPRNGGNETWDDAIGKHGPFPDTVEVQTGGGGRHFYVKAPAGLIFPAKLGPGVEIKGAGQILVAPPSMHISGRQYEFEASSNLFEGQAIADMPDWMVQLARPAILDSGPVATVAATTGDWSPEKEEEIRGWLTRIPADDYHIWMKVLMALSHEGKTEQAFRLADEYSRACPEKYNQAELRKKWNSLEVGKPGGITLASLEYMAKCGVDDTSPDIDIDALFGKSSPPPEQIAQNSTAEAVVPITKAGTPAADTWPDPRPIQAPLYPVPAFDPVALLPEMARGWVMDEADRMPCSPDYIAVGMLVICGSIIGARCAIKPKLRDDWQIVPNLWGGIVGLPSAKKSPAISAALKPLDRLIAKAIEEHQEELRGYQATSIVSEAKRDALQSQIKAAAKQKKGLSDLDSMAHELVDFQNQSSMPVLRRYKTNDATVEKLGEILQQNPQGVLMLRDELVGLIASWDREGREGERAFYLEAWNGNSSFDTDRIGRGSIFISNVCVSIFGGIQPDKLVGYLEQASHALANDGMLQRFQLLVYPDPRPWEYRDRLPNKEARERVFDAVGKLADFDPVAWGAVPADDHAKFPYFRFDEEAHEIFVEWSTDLHRVRMPAEDNPIIVQHLAKYDKLFPTLALIFHLLDCAATGRRGPVNQDAALRAAAWCDYLESHARRCYGLLQDDGLRAAQSTLR